MLIIIYTDLIIWSLCSLSNMKLTHNYYPWITYNVSLLSSIYNYYLLYTDVWSLICCSLLLCITMYHNFISSFIHHFICIYSNTFDMSLLSHTSMHYHMLCSSWNKVLQYNTMNKHAFTACISSRSLLPSLTTTQ